LFFPTFTKRKKEIKVKKWLLLFPSKGINKEKKKREKNTNSNVRNERYGIWRDHRTRGGKERMSRAFESG
jgi:hypothetical protein